MALHDYVCRCKTVKYEGRNQSQSTKDALINAAKTKLHNTNRESNSNYYNMKAKQNRDKEDDKTLVRNLKAVKKQS
jgi:ATP phosphoribosyltransferase